MSVDQHDRDPTLRKSVDGVGEADAGIPRPENDGRPVGREGRDRTPHGGRTRRPVLTFAGRASDLRTRGSFDEVPLVDPDSAVSESVLEQMYSEHLEGIRELSQMLEAPPHPVTDPSRIALARSFAHNALQALASTEGRRDRGSLLNRVNLSYEVMLILIDYVKTYTDGPRVPRGRQPASSPAAPS